MIGIRWSIVLPSGRENLSRSPEKRINKIYI